MIADEFGKKLHDRATRGEPLSETEQEQLDEWYARQDRAEENELGLNPASQATFSLQTQINSALAQLAATTRRIQEIAEENEALRREITLLHQQLAQQPAPQTV